MATNQLSLSEGTITYELSGPDNGPLVVFAHGMGDTRATYRFLIPVLAANGFRVAAMDVRGYGDSSLGWPEYSTPAVAHDIAALIRELGGPAVLVGHSFTAGSAALVAADTPELVTKIVMFGPAVRQSKLNPIMRLAAKLVTSNATLWTMFYKSLYPGRKPADFGTYLRDLKASLKRKGRIAAVSGLMASFPTETPADLSKIESPVLIVMGDKDGDFPDPKAEAERIAAELSGPARVAMVTGSGHYPHADNPEAVTPVVLSFLERN